MKRPVPGIPAGTNQLVGLRGTDIKTPGAFVREIAELLRGPFRPAEYGRFGAVQASPYRAEIDGLRALAIVAVIINHFDSNILPSGYLGVDIFFVISGFVITSALVERKRDNCTDFLLNFYLRRLKRLVPALVLL